MNYKVLILRRAQKELSYLPGSTYLKVNMTIQKLALDPSPSGSQKLSGREGWRIRAGDRVIYEIDNSDHSVTILHIGHRRDVYRY